MTRTYATSLTPSLGFNRTGLPIVEVVSNVARRLWPFKTARHLAQRCGVTERAAEFYLSGSSTGMNADALAELLRSDAGFKVLEAIMGDAKPSWWPKFAVQHAIDELAKKQAETARSLEALRAQL